MANLAEDLDICRILLTNVPFMTAELLSTALAADGDVVVTGSVQAAEDVPVLLEQHAPHVVLVGSRSGRGEPTGLAFLQQIRQATVATRPVVLASEHSSEDELALFYAGARGLLCESKLTLSILIKCIRCVAAGEVWANSRQLDVLLASLTRPRTARITNALGAMLLSRREEEVLQLLSEGMSNRELAKLLKLSEHTVKNHLFRIFDKLGVSNRMEAVLYAMSQSEQRQFVPMVDR